jgi:hypothetical protein
VAANRALLETDPINQLYQLLAAMSPPSDWANLDDLVESDQNKLRPCHRTLAWVLRGLSVIPQSLQWGRLVFLVMQMLSEDDPAIPAVIRNSTPPLFVAFFGYLMNAIVPFMLVDWMGTANAAHELVSEYHQAATKKAKARNVLRWVSSLFFVASGILYYWPVVGEPPKLSNQSYLDWKKIYDAIDDEPPLYWANIITFILFTALIMGPPGFALAKMLDQKIAYLCAKDKEQEVRRIEHRLVGVLQKPDLALFFQMVDKKRAENPTGDLGRFLKTELEAIDPMQLAVVAMYAHNRRPLYSQVLTSASSWIIPFILNYGFIPFTLAVFRTLSSITDVVSAMMAITATMTNFMLTLSLSDEILSFMKGLFPCRSSKAGLISVGISLFLAGTFLLYFSSLIYVPEVFQEPIADCAFNETITNITSSSNVTIACPEDSEAWFAVQLILSMLNPFLFNLALTAMLFKNAYEKIKACLGEKYSTYSDIMGWYRFRLDAVRTLQGAVESEQFLKRLTQKMLSSGDKLSELFCLVAYENIVMTQGVFSDTRVQQVLTEVAGGDISLPERFGEAAPFKTRCFSYLEQGLSLVFLLAAILCYQLTSDEEIAHLPKAGDSPIFFPVVLFIWLSGQGPQFVDLARLCVDKAKILSIYQDSSRKSPFQSGTEIALKRPILGRPRYFGWQVFAALTSIPLLSGMYHFVVMMLKPAIELNLSQFDSQVEFLVSFACQKLALSVLVYFVILYQKYVLTAALTSPLNPSAGTDSDLFRSVVPFSGERVRATTEASDRFQNFLSATEGLDQETKGQGLVVGKS